MGQFDDLLDEPTGNFDDLLESPKQTEQEQGSPLSNALGRVNDSIAGVAVQATEKVAKPAIHYVDRKGGEAINASIDYYKSSPKLQMAVDQVTRPLKDLDTAVGEAIPKPLQGMAAAYIGKQVSDAVDFASKSLGAPEVINRYVKDYTSAILQASVGSAGSIARVAGLENLGNVIEKSVAETSKQMAPPNPDITDAIVSSLGSATSFFLPGIGVEYGTARIAVVAPRLARFLGLATNTVLEAMMEGGQTYSKIFDATGDRRKALIQATKVFGANVPFIGLTNKLGFASDEANKVTKALESFFTEGSQEAGQSIISMIAQHDPITGEALKQIGMEFAVGGITGGLMGLAHPSHAGLTQSTIQPGESLATQPLPAPVSGLDSFRMMTGSDAPVTTLNNPNLTDPAAFPPAPTPEQVVEKANVDASVKAIPKSELVAPGTAETAPAEAKIPPPPKKDSQAVSKPGKVDISGHKVEITEKDGKFTAFIPEVGPANGEFKTREEAIASAQTSIDEHDQYLTDEKNADENLKLAKDDHPKGSDLTFKDGDTELTGKVVGHDSTKDSYTVSVKVGEDVHDVTYPVEGGDQASSSVPGPVAQEPSPETPSSQTEVSPSTKVDPQTGEVQKTEEGEPSLESIVRRKGYVKAKAEAMDVIRAQAEDLGLDPEAPGTAEKLAKILHDDINKAVNDWKNSTEDWKNKMDSPEYKAASAVADQAKREMESLTALAQLESDPSTIDIVEQMYEKREDAEREQNKKDAEEARKLLPYNGSLIQMVKKMGINRESYDRHHGGELSSIEQRGDYRFIFRKGASGTKTGGSTIGELAQRAFEEGLIPEYDEVAFLNALNDEQSRAKPSEYKKPLTKEERAQRKEQKKKMEANGLDKASLKRQKAQNKLNQAQDRVVEAQESQPPEIPQDMLMSSRAALELASAELAAVEAEAKAPTLDVTSVAPTGVTTGVAGVEQTDPNDLLEGFRADQNAEMFPEGSTNTKIEAPQAPLAAVPGPGEIELARVKAEIALERTKVDIIEKNIKQNLLEIDSLDKLPGNKTEVILQKIIDLQQENIASEKELLGIQAGIATQEQAAASLRSIYGIEDTPNTGLVEVKPIYDGGSPGASKGNFSSDTPVELGGMIHVKPFRMPELVRMCYELIGSVPNIKKMSRANGYFRYGGGKDAFIALNASIFNDPAQAAKTLAHEIGHLMDYLDTKTMKRGNIWGSVQSLNKYMAETFGALSVTNKEMRDELLEVTMYWRPYDDKNSSKAYIAYRRSSRELYADALSVLLNSPGTLERMAPRFYQEFFKGLDSKPNVKNTFFNFVKFLNGSEMEIQEFRLLDRQAMFREAEDIFKEKRNKEKTSINAWEWTKQHFVDKFDIIVSKVQADESNGIVLDPRSDPRYMLEELALPDNNNHALLEEIGTKVDSILDKFELSKEDLGDYLLLTRIAGGDRQAFANTKGYNPVEATKALEYMVGRLGLERFEKLKEAATNFREIVFQKAVEAVEVGAYNRDVFNEKILPNRGTYAVFAVHDYLEDRISAGVKQQIGSMKDIANPYTTTMMKMVALNRLIAKQKAANSTRDFLVPRGEMTKAEIANPGDKMPIFRGKPGFEVLEFLENGHKVGYYVDPYIAEAFDKYPPGTFHLGMEFQKRMFNGIFRPLWITYNIGFQLFRNPIRDYFRTNGNLYALSENSGYGSTVKSLLIAYAKSLGSAGRRAAGIHDSLISEMIANKSLDVSFTDYVFDSMDSQYTSVQRKLGIGEIRKDGMFEKAAKHKILKYIVATLEGIRFIGNTFETISKVAGYKVMKADSLKTLDKAISLETDLEKKSDLIKERALLQKGQGVYSHKLAYNTRNFVGTPNWRKGGSTTSTSNTIFPFSNIMIQGLKADLQLATRPKTRAGYALNMTLTQVMPKMLMALAAAGIAGDEVKEAFAKMSEYDKTNYICVPVGFQEGEDGHRKVTYFRIPHDETGRLIAGVFWKMTNGANGDPRFIQEILGLGLGQLPKLAPQLTLAATWAAYLSGQNPYDSFRGRNLLSKKTYEAGGLYSLKKMVSWTSNQFGLTSFTTQDESTKSTAEAFLDMTPIGSVFKISDYGEQEKVMRMNSDKQAEKSRLSLDRGTAAIKYTKELYTLNQKFAAGALTSEEKRRLQILKSRQSIYNSFTKSIETANKKGDSDKVEKLRARLDEHLSKIIK